jgi:hypothetical protein
MTNLSNGWESGAIIGRFPIRGFLLFLMLTSTGVFVSSIWKLHSVRNGSFRIAAIDRIRAIEGDGYAFDEVESLKREIREVIRSENRELLQQLFERISIVPLVDKPPAQSDVAAITKLVSSANGTTETLIDLTMKVPYQKQLTKEFWSMHWKLIIENDAKVREYLDSFEKVCETHDNLEQIVNRRSDRNMNRSEPLCPCVPGTLSKYIATAFYVPTEHYVLGLSVRPSVHHTLRGTISCSQLFRIVWMGGIVPVPADL